MRTRLGWRWLTALGMAMSLVAGILVSDNARAQVIEKPRATSAKSALDKYTRDITAAAEQGRFDSLTERQDEINRAIEILSRTHKHNPVVLTDSQAIRDLVAAGIARRIATGEVPEALQDKRLLKLDLDLLFHDVKSGAELVNKLSEILSDVAHSESKIILLIDPIQSLVGRSAAFDGAASSLLREAIRNGDVQCLGASTDIMFQESVASDESLTALFAAVEMQEVGDANAQQSEDDGKADDKAKTKAEEFVGDKVSPDLRELLDSPNAPSHVKAILQVNDTNSTALRAQLSRYGVNVDAQMLRFGACGRRSGEGD